jgi:hypothetical protein
MYDGSAAALDDWLAEIERQTAWYSMSETEGLRMAAGFLKPGPALDWWKHLPQKPTSCHELATLLRARFQPVTTEEATRQQLFGLKQGKTPINDFIATFRKLAARLPTMAEGDKLHLFVHALRPAMQTQLKVHNVKTLDAAIDMAARLGNLGDASFGSLPPGGPMADAMQLDAVTAGEDTGSSSSGATTSGTARKSDPSAAPWGALTELLNAMREERRADGSASSSRDRGRERSKYQQRGPPRIPHLSEEQVKAYMDADKCFACGKTGHQSRACPNKKKSQDF